MQSDFTPKWIAWETTKQCNLRCIHCRCVSGADSPERELTTREGKKLLKDIARVSKPVVVLSGGEPLLRDDIFELAVFGSELGLRVCMAVNGTMVTGEVCRDMERADIRMVSISLDGASASVHDDFRQSPGSFDSVLRAAELFRKNGLKFIINSSFTKRNQRDIVHTFDLAKKLGAEAWYMFMIVPKGRGADIMNELISDEDYDEILKWHYEQEKIEDTILMRPTCAPHYYRIVSQLAKAEKSDFKRRSLSFSTGGGKGCIAGQSICMIDSFGNVKPCSYFLRSAGNVRRMSFRKIWENSDIFRNLRDFKMYRGKCGSCKYISVCGGCRARADALHGDYMGEDPVCAYSPAGLRKI